MRPLATVEKESFKSLVTGLCPTATVMCRKTLQSRIIDTYDNMVSQLQTELNGAAYVCTTADIWSSTNRSFLGMTAHWFDAESLVRKSAAIAIQRFKGKHSVDKIAGAISQTHARFGIESKVIMTCTDNGSNMVKAFGEFTRKNQTTVNESFGDNNEARSESGSDCSEDEIDDGEQSGEILQLWNIWFLTV